ncbi:hypothetical protein MiAbW_02736 [Microcystis aeruginosa NIES-4325]|uniref:Uncharacterized protein n=1 Tax=Microcystis aeruginosa NIES-4325 TaxID=2569534 RepID=A0A5J4FAY7_MICAE|nr:hypothetical protein MiAbW_02736 [Microcystis aeruginosa NIES-4325]
MLKSLIIKGLSVSHGRENRYKPRERLKEGYQYKTKPQIGRELIKKLKEM